MDGLILGIDLDDLCCRISCFSPKSGRPEPVQVGEEESSARIPTALCKVRGREEWLIGADGYRRALLGEGTTVDKLVQLLKKDGSATIEGVTYPAAELLCRYLEKLLELPKKQFGCEKISLAAFGLSQPDAELMDRLSLVCRQAGLAPEQFCFISHTECLACYIGEQPKELWVNPVVCFELADRGLEYFEFRVIRGRKPPVAEARREHLEEGFDLNLLETPMGERMADTILTVCADRKLQKKLISSVLLTGEGFADVKWAPGFIRKLCNKRKVFQAPQLFADGAALAARDRCSRDLPRPYVLLCEGRLSSTISMYAVQNGKNEAFILASAGENWYEARSVAEFILDDTHSLELLVTPFATQRVETLNLSLAELPARPNKTTRIRLELFFTAEDRVHVRVTDRGFGELFPAGGMIIEREFLIS